MVKYMCLTCDLIRFFPSAQKQVRHPLIFFSFFFSALLFRQRNSLVRIFTIHIIHARARVKKEGLSVLYSPLPIGRVKERKRGHTLARALSFSLSLCLSLNPYHPSSRKNKKIKTVVNTVIWENGEGGKAGAHFRRGECDSFLLLLLLLFVCLCRPSFPLVLLSLILFATRR